MVVLEGARMQWKQVKRKDFVNIPMIVRMFFIAQTIVQPRVRVKLHGYLSTKRYGRMLLKDIVSNHRDNMTINNSTVVLDVSPDTTCDMLYCDERPIQYSGVYVCISMQTVCIVPVIPA